MGRAGAPAANGISVPVTMNRSSVTRSSAGAVADGGVADEGLDGAAVWATTAEKRPVPVKRQSTAINFRVRMFIVISVVVVVGRKRLSPSTEVHSAELSGLRLKKFTCLR